MIGAKVNLSRESERQAIIQDLQLLGKDTGQLDGLDYHTLRSMLAVARAVAN